MRKTKILCTIGPASESRTVFTRLVEEGLDLARLNFSHGTHDEHLARIEMIQDVRREKGLPIAIVLDTKGPEIRTGSFTTKEVHLEAGQPFVLYSDGRVGDTRGCSISYEDLYQDVEPGSRILIDDGLVELRVEAVEDRDIHTVVVNAGTVSDHKGINVPDVRINLPAVTEKDRQDLIFGVEHGIDFVAASFIRKASDVMAVREVLEQCGGHDIQIISKIENREGVENLEEIIEVSDGIMVARGDLGVEIPPEEVPILQKRIIRLCNKVGKPVVTATQMLDSMIRNPRPTRAEATDVANAIFDGTDGLMLSGETAAGKYPVEAVRTMASIAVTTEESICYRDELDRRIGLLDAHGVTFAVSHATVSTANELFAKAIITATSSGFTARKVSMLRPQAPIIAATYTERVRRKLALVFGVYPILMREAPSTDEIFEKVIETAQKQQLVDAGDLVVITAGVPVGVAGTTNLMKVHVVQELMIKGLGFGKVVVTYPVKVLLTEEDAREKFQDGDIIVTDAVESYLVPYIERASGLIVEEGGYTSAGALVAINLHLPAVVGAAEATRLLEDGMSITLDAKKGLVYSSHHRMI